MRLLAYARHELIDRTPPPLPTGRVSPDGDLLGDVLLLLEGSWPSDAPYGVHHSLDEAIDGRFDWIDQQAADFAELLGGGDPEGLCGHGVAHCESSPAREGGVPGASTRTTPPFRAGLSAGGTRQGSSCTTPHPGGPGRPLGGISPAYLNALALRYYLVKLIRPLAYFSEVQPLGPGDRIELVAAAGRDTDYAGVLSQYCRAAGVFFRVRWVDGMAGRPAAGFPANGRWRRCIARLSGLLQPSPDPHGPGRRVVLCGNPRLLDPVCRELLARGCNLWWLGDRFAVRSWFRWQSAGVGQLACNSSLEKVSGTFCRDGPKGASHKRFLTPFRLDCRGVNLAGPVRRWLTTRVAIHGPRQTRLLEQIDAHFGRVRPDALVLDEDATPLARAALAVGRRYGAASFVVQHGVPYCRFGFAPPAADRILVWGRSSRQRLIDWGVPPRRIRLTGSPSCDRLWYKLQVEQRREFRRRRRAGRPRILLLATVPPRDDRPDAVALHLTGRTYARMLRMAFAAVAGTDCAELDGAELDGAELDGAELIVKLHPRSGDDPVVRAVRAEFDSVDSRLVRRGPLEKWLAGVHCVLSCGSSAGVEATLAGVPVIQLAPPGGSGFLPHDRWGLAGTACSRQQLRELLARLAADGWPAPPGPDPGVFAAFDRPAAARIADEVLAPIVESGVPRADGRHPARGGAARQALPAGYCEEVNESVHR